MLLSCIFVYTLVSFINLFFFSTSAEYGYCKMETGYLLQCKSIVCCLMLPLYLQVLLLIPSTLTLASQLSYTRYFSPDQTFYQIVWTRCSTNIDFPFDTSSTKKMMMIFWFVDLLDPFGSRQVSLWIVWINCFRTASSCN